MKKIGFLFLFFYFGIFSSVFAVEDEYVTNQITTLEFQNRSANITKEMNYELQGDIDKVPINSLVRVIGFADSSINPKLNSKTAQKIQIKAGSNRRQAIIKWLDKFRPDLTIYQEKDQGVYVYNGDDKKINARIVQIYWQEKKDNTKKVVSSLNTQIVDLKKDVKVFMDKTSQNVNLIAKSKLIDYNPQLAQITKNQVKINETQRKNFRVSVIVACGMVLIFAIFLLTFLSKNTEKEAAVKRISSTDMLLLNRDTKIIIPQKKEIFLKFKVSGKKYIAKLSVKDGKIKNPLFENSYFQNEKDAEKSLSSALNQFFRYMEEVDNEIKDEDRKTSDAFLRNNWNEKIDKMLEFGVIEPG